MKTTAVVALFVAAILFGCIGGGGGGTPTPTATPMATPTPVVTRTPTPAPTATPAVTQTPVITPTPTPAGMATPTPEPQLSWAELFGCTRTGISYAYRMTSAGGTVDVGYSMSEGGMVGGVDTVLKASTIEMGGTTVTTREWDTKVGCRCVKVEQTVGGQTMPGQCAAPGEVGGGEPQGAQTTITSLGTEQISVPAYTGSAMKYRVRSVGASGTSEADVWITPSVPVALKMRTADATVELLRYSTT